MFDHRAPTLCSSKEWGTIQRMGHQARSEARRKGPGWGLANLGLLYIREVGFISVREDRVG